MAKSKYLQIRVSDDEEQWIDALAEDYDLDRSKLILFSLEYIERERPAFMIQPKGKECAPAGMTA